MNKKVLLAVSSFAKNDKTPENLLLSKGFSLIKNPYGRTLKKDELLKLLENDVCNVIAGLEPYDNEVLAKSNLKTISRVGSGISNIDLEQAEKLNIKVFSTPFAPIQSVAEITIGAILSLIRHIHIMNKDMHNKKWEKKIGYELSGKTALIIGFGNIGQKVAELLKPFNVQIIIFDPFKKSTHSLAEGLKQADIITLHSSSEGYILSEKEFMLMKEGVFLLNFARGSQISEKALISALDTCKVQGAHLDVFSDEPYNNSLCDCENVILTPHIASYTYECRKKMELQAVENLVSNC